MEINEEECDIIWKQMIIIQFLAFNKRLGIIKNTQLYMINEILNKTSDNGLKWTT